MIQPEHIAAICHEANRRYCRETGDRSQKPWEEAPWWQRQSAISGVLFVMNYPDAGPAAAHENWLQRKIAEGWVYGPEKDESKKIHPCVVSYDQLPPEQKIKDLLFHGIVTALTRGEKNA